MLRRSDAADIARFWAPGNLMRVGPGICLCALIAAVAYALDVYGLTRFARFFIPSLIVALTLGMALQPLAASAPLKSGIDFSGRTLLRVGVALLGARLTLGDLVDGGALPVVIAISAVTGTIVFGAWGSRMFGLSREFGVLTGCATGVCGAAAAMAASAVLPKDENSERDLAFTVMGVNFLSTIIMVAYPPLREALSFTPFEMGVFLGGSIHDVAQVAGAGQSAGSDALAVAIVTKLMRVALLLPAIAAIAWWVARGGRKAGDARPAPPIFLFGFLALVTLNSFDLVPGAMKAALAQISSFLIITAIAALGLKTSLRSLVRIGPGSVALLVAETLFVGLLVAALIYALR